jgi:uncharacterized protein (TIGR03435 family)
MRPLLQKLLQQRLKLTAHRESRSVTGFALVVAKGGSKIQGSKDGDKPFFYIFSNGVEERATSIVTLAAVLELPSGAQSSTRPGSQESMTSRCTMRPQMIQSPTFPTSSPLSRSSSGSNSNPRKFPSTTLSSTTSSACRRRTEYL